MHQQSSRTNGYPESTRIYTIYGIGGKIGISTCRQPDNTSIATKPEDTYTLLIEQIRTKVIEWNSTNGGWNSVG